MPHRKQIATRDFDYRLPPSSIARYPVKERDGSKLLLYNRGAISHHAFRALPELVDTGSWMVFNDTKVIPARLRFQKSTGAGIEIFCLEPASPGDYTRALQSTGTCSWKCLVGNARKWKRGTLALEAAIGHSGILLEASIEGALDNGYLIRFSWTEQEITFGEILESAGATPVPPYLRREAETIDRSRYQTVYGKDPGSVAAPTAGLHFTSGTMAALRENGVRMANLTLHVGAGTFVPVTEPNAREHTMHTEHVTVPTGFIRNWSSDPAPLLAVGTTTTRSLESLYWLGVKLLAGSEMEPGGIHLDQWEYEDLPQERSLDECLRAVLTFCDRFGLDSFGFTTGLMIVPGYGFRSVDGLITNYHMPGSSLLMLIAAFIGEDWKEVYRRALAGGYRFLSYGDSSLLFPRD